MEYLELWWLYSKPASVEDKEQSEVPLTVPLFVDFPLEGAHSTQTSAIAGGYRRVFWHQ
jgi:hypothetical protein